MRLQTASWEQTSFSSEEWVQTKSHVKSKPSICYIDTQPIWFKKKQRQRFCNNLPGIRLQRQAPPKGLHSWPRDFFHEVVCRDFFFCLSTLLFSAHTLFQIAAQTTSPPPSHLPLLVCAHVDDMRRWGSMLQSLCTLEHEMPAKNNFPFKKSRHSIHLVQHHTVNFAVTRDKLTDFFSKDPIKIWKCLLLLP